MAEVSPVAFVEAALAYQKTAAIKAAVDLDLFTIIGLGTDSIEQLAATTGGSARGLRILCDYLSVQGFLEKADGRYTPTAASRAFLDRRSPTYMGSIVDFHASPDMCTMFLADPVAYIRNGGAVGLGSVAPDHPVWATFARAMAPIMAPIARIIARQIAASPPLPGKILDVAAGHGLFGIAVAKAVPEAEVVAVDWPSVLTFAQANAAEAGIAERFRTVAGNAFEVNWGSGYDLVLVPNFLHHFDPETCVGLLRKIRSSLAPGGRALAVEFVPNEDRISPTFQASFAFYMLGSTPHGDAFTPSDFVAMARAAGFSGATVTPVPRSPQSLVAFE
jgi:2-polyprenyl-3-methyl-5-hydroxy-6-metoxy-1,4-benzoquinol methylase